MRKKYLPKLILEASKTGIRELSEKIGVGYYALYRIINNKSMGSIESWENIVSYYKTKK
jgi:hypothetical protein